jgi:spore maturation protein CgeB
VAEILEALREEDTRELGRAARARVLAEHTYDHRALEVEAVLGELLAERARPLAASGEGRV